MKSSLQSIFWVLLIFCSTVQTQSQTAPPKKEAPCSISGKVTIKGKGAPGIVVGMRAADFGSYASQWTAPNKATTDQDGNYKITNVAPGSYRIEPAAPAFVNSGDLEGKTLIITAGETVEDIDFTLTLGGVITGKVVDSEDLPLIEEQVNLLPAEANTQIRQYMNWPGMIRTDDRGIYRIFGIPPGRYKVAVGQSEDGSLARGPRRSRHKQTFAPGVTDSSKASVIEVTEGSEATNVDITAGRSLGTFAVSGRIFNGETLQPLPNITLGLQRIVAHGTEFMNWGSTSNIKGEFKLENVTPGKYELVLPPQTNGMRADTVQFEVIDADVSGLQVKTAEGAVVSGHVVMEGRNDRAVLGRLGQMWLHTYVSSAANDRATSWIRPVTISPDGSFQIRGLQSGVAHFTLTAADARPITGLAIVRIERDGMAQPAGVEIKDGERVTGVRLVVNYGTGKIRGLVKIENVELPANARFFVRFTIPGAEPTRFSTLPSPEVDSRGHFFIEGLAAGTYQVHATMFMPGSQIRPPSVTQQVNVADGTVTELTLTLKLEPTPGPGNP